MLSLIVHLAVVVILAEAGIQKRCASSAGVLIPALILSLSKDARMPAVALSIIPNPIARFDR
ncbi:MAG TPA: hypothetical protein VME69_07185 [Methylocella sp.]|nr:hypothetical protein [Methylocella sp.]